MFWKRKHQKDNDENELTFDWFTKNLPLQVTNASEEDTCLEFLYSNGLGILKAEQLVNFCTSSSKKERFEIAKRIENLVSTYNIYISDSTDSVTDFISAYQMRLSEETTLRTLEFTKTKLRIAGDAISLLTKLGKILVTF